MFIPIVTKDDHCYFDRLLSSSILVLLIGHNLITHHNPVTSYLLCMHEYLLDLQIHLKHGQVFDLKLSKQVYVKCFIFKHYF